MTAAARDDAIVSAAALAARLADLPAAVVHARCRELLGLTSDVSAPAGSSTLNANGAPLELCLSFSGARCRPRLLVDPGYSIQDDPPRRLALTRRIVHSVAGPRTATHRALEQLLDGVGPRTVDELATYTSGVAWVAVGTGDDGLAVYVDLSPRDQVGSWSAVEIWMESSAQDTAFDLRPIRELRARAIPTSCGVEEDVGGAIRLKTYFRVSDDSASGLEAAVGGDAAQGLAALGATLRSGQPLRDRTALLSVSYAASGPDWIDVKLDLCACERCLGGVSWPSVLCEIGRTFDTAIDRELVVDAVGTMDVAFVGVGFGRFGTALRAPRLNVYLRPQSWPA